MTSERPLPVCEAPEPVRSPRPRTAVLVMLLGLLAPLLLGWDALVGPYSSVQSPWSVTIARRVEAHARAITRPKIIFVGGSNMIFGIDTHALEADLGVPVIDYAVNAGIGFDVIANRVLRYIQPGDIVVAAPELPHFTTAGCADPALRGDFARLFPVRINDPLFRFPLRQWTACRERCRAVVAACEAWWTHRLMKWWIGFKDPPADQAVSVYDLKAIDAEGRVTYPRPRPAPWANPNELDPPWPDAIWYAMNRSSGAAGLRMLATMCRARHATFLIMPAVRTYGKAPEGSKIEISVEGREEDMLRSAEAIGAHRLLGPGETAVPPRFAYDTTYHLNDLGAAMIHERLVPALRRWVEQMPATRADATVMESGR